MDVDFQFGLLRGKVRVKKNPPRSGVLSIVPHQDVGDQIVIDITNHDDVQRNSDAVQIRDILQFVHDYSKISNNLKPQGLYKFYIRSLNRKNMLTNSLGGIGQFFDNN